MSRPKRGVNRTAGATPVDMLRHKDKRANIPTDELRAFVAEDEAQPNTLLYPRDPSLDPQLVWKGKDEQDKADLAVPIVPIYIQEKLHPRVIIENLRDTAAAGEPEPELSLFDDFNGIEFEQLVDFYQHEQNWSNRLILGDSLLVMNSLAEKEGLKGKVQTIYFDPPYGIKFGSNWQVSTRKREVKDGKVEDATRQPEQVRAFRDTWELGIHSYLAYMRDRLTVAHALLTDTGSIFVQIGDENVHLVRSLLDEVFGSECFCSQISFRTKIPLRTTLLPNIFDHVLWYARSADHGVPKPKFRRLFQQRDIGEGTQFTWVEESGGTRRRMTSDERRQPALLPKGARAFRLTDLVSAGRTESCVFSFELDGTTISEPRSGKSWKTTPDGMRALIAARRVFAPGGTPGYVFYAQDYPVQELANVWTDTQGATDRRYVVQTGTKVIERCLLMTTDPGDLVLDPTCGSGTTAYVAEQWGRRWITVDTSRVAVALAKTRLMSGRYPSYILSDSPEGQRRDAELRSVECEPRPTAHDVRKGFIYRRVPHVTLGSFTQELVDEGEVESPREEILVDQPYEMPSHVRVAGPFTVESLSPHRVLGYEDQQVSDETREDGAPFATAVLENLGKAGVQNTVKQEHLDFDWLEPFAGSWVHARGEFTDADGTSRTVAVSIGPEHGTVGTDQVKEAAKEALKGAGVDLLLVCAFAFDAHAGEVAKEFQPDATSGWAVAAEEKRIGKLPLLLVRMNPDLAMGDELLKKTGAGNLFMVFGEPDIAIEREDGQIVAEVRGVDVYDPTTGQVRSSSVDDIACWMIDTNYNGESFFVRHAYFTGAEDPYKSLKRALKADIDEEAWESLYRTRSRPFDPPSTKRIAVKVINHYGDEVMKTYSID